MRGRSGRAAARVLSACVPLVLFAFASSGCSKKIGDKCTTSSDCSSNGDRLCDTTQPDGYCTIFNCEPDTCPSDEAQCVAFTEDSCPAGTGVNLSRLQRTFCMATCDDNGDCRGGYVCQDMGSNVIDTNPSNRKVCVVSQSTSSVLDAGSYAVCEPGDGSLLTGSESGDSGDADAIPVDGAAAPVQSGPNVDASSEADGSQEDGGQGAGEAVPDASSD